MRGSKPVSISWSKKTLMPISEETVAAFLKCETKAYLKYKGILGTQSEFSQFEQHQLEEYKSSCRELLCSALHTASFVGTPDLKTDVIK